MKKINLLGRGEIPIRFFFFLCLGILSGFYLFFPTKFKGELSKFESSISALSIFFGIIYLFAYVILLALFENFKKLLMKIKKLFRKIRGKSEINEIPKKTATGAEIMGDIMMYYLGGFFGIVLFMILGTITLVGFGLFHLGKLLAELNVKEFFGILSAIIVLVSYPPYIIRIWQKKITPNLSSWIIFVLVSVAICLSSYSSSGAGKNSWVTFGAFAGCSIVLTVALLRSKEKSFTGFDIACLILGIISIIFWFFTKQSRELVQFSLYLGILADFIGILPSAKYLAKNPEEDRPFLWIIFSFGYFLSIFAITEHTFANWVLPLFMTLAPALVWIHLVKYRIKNKISLKEWI